MSDSFCTATAVDRVAQVRRLAHKCQAERRNCDEIRRNMTELTRRLEASGNEYARAYRDLMALLKDMDLTSSGNNGWDQRIVMLLGEILEQEKAK